MKKTGTGTVFLVALLWPLAVLAHEGPEGSEATEPASHLEKVHEMAPELEGPSEHAVHVGPVYVVKRGDTLDRIIQKNMPDSPLKLPLLRQAIAKANPEAFPRPGDYRLRAGAVLHLPNSAELLHSVVDPILQPWDEAHGRGDRNARDQDAQRHWVRYP